MDAQAQLDRGLAEANWTLVRATGHPLWRCPCGKHTLTVPASGSDWRGPLNSLAQFRRQRDECEGRARPAPAVGQRREKRPAPNQSRREAEQVRREREAFAARRQREADHAEKLRLEEEAREAERLADAERAAKADRWRRDIEALMRPGGRR